MDETDFGMASSQPTDDPGDEVYGNTYQLVCRRALPHTIIFRIDQGVQNIHARMIETPIES